VLVETDYHSTNATYTLIVNNVRDRANSANTIAPDSKITYQWEEREQFSVTNLSPNGYRTDSLQVGDRYYVDRNFSLVNIPPQFANILWILTKNDDKNVTDQQWLSFDVNQTVTVGVAYDISIASLPSWLLDWHRTGLHITTTDDSPLSIYTKRFAPGTIVLGGNNGNDSGSMYIVLLKSAINGDITPPQPPTGLILGAG